MSARFPHGSFDVWVVRYMAALFLAAMFGIAGCPKPLPVPVPPPDASDSGDDVSAPAIPDAAAEADSTPPSECALACATLRKIGCSGINDACPATLEKIQNDRLIVGKTGAPITCARLKTATTAKDVAGMGVKCP